MSEVPLQGFTLYAFGLAAKMVKNACFDRTGQTWMAIPVQESGFLICGFGFRVWVGESESESEGESESESESAKVSVILSECVCVCEGE